MCRIALCGWRAGGRCSEEPVGGFCRYHGEGVVLMGQYRYHPDPTGRRGNDDIGKRFPLLDRHAAAGFRTRLHASACHETLDSKCRRRTMRGRGRGRGDSGVPCSQAGRPPVYTGSEPSRSSFMSRVEYSPTCCCCCSISTTSVCECDEGGYNPGERRSEIRMVV